MVFSEMDLANIGGYFNIRALKLVRTSHIFPLKVPRGRTRSVCMRIHLYPYPTLALKVKGLFINDAIFFRVGVDPPFPPCNEK